MLVAAAALAVVAWIVAPWVAMARHGTLDAQALDDIRAPVIPRPRLPSHLPVATGPRTYARAGDRLPEGVAHARQRIPRTGPRR